MLFLRLLVFGVLPSPPHLCALWSVRCCELLELGVGDIRKLKLLTSLLK